MKNNKIIFMAIFLVSSFVGIFFFTAFKSTTSRKKVEILNANLTVLKVHGKVMLEKLGKSEDLVEGAILDKNCSVISEDHSYALLGKGKNFSSKIKVGPNTSFSISKFKLNFPDQSEGLTIKMIAGDILFNIFNPSKQKSLIIKTKTASMGIRGTTFFVKANNEKAVLLVKEGAVQLENNFNQNSMFVYSDTGYSIDSKGKMVAEKLSNYQVNWNLESQAEVISDQTDFGLIIENSLKNILTKIEALNSELLNQNQKLDQLDKTNESELVIIEKDQDCLVENLVGCQLHSKAFADNPLYNRENEKRFLTPKVKEGLKKDLENYKKSLSEEQQKIKVTISEIKKDVFELENKYHSSRTALNQLNSLSKDEKSKASHLVYKNIVLGLKDNNLTNEFNR